MPEQVVREVLDGEIVDPTKDETTANPGAEARLVPVAPTPPSVVPEFRAKAAIQFYDEIEEFMEHVVRRDWIRIKGKHYLKATGLQKLAQALHLSTPIVKEWIVEPRPGVREFWFKVECRGRDRVTEGIACCSTVEKWSEGKPVTAVAAFGQTRARNIAVRTYFGLTGPSAEEMMDGTEPKPEDESDVEDGEGITENQLHAIFAASSEKGYTGEQVREWIRKRYAVRATKDLTRAQASGVLDKIARWPTAVELRALREKEAKENGPLLSGQAGKGPSI